MLKLYNHRVYHYFFCERIQKSTKMMQTHCNLSSDVFLKIRKSFENFRGRFATVLIFVRNIYPCHNLSNLN